MPCRVVVVGSGIAGLCVARELANLDCRVTLLSGEAQPSASRAAAGLLSRAGGRISRPHLELRQKCLSAYPQFLSDLTFETGEAISFSDSGHLRFTTSTQRISSLQSFAGTLRGLGLEARLLVGPEVKQLEPGVPEDIQAAVHLSDGRVEPARLLDTLQASLNLRGVKCLETSAQSISEEGLLLEGGEQLAAEAIVVAAGPSSWALLGERELSFQTDPGWCLQVVPQIPLSVSLEDPYAPWTLVPQGKTGARLASSGEFPGTLPCGLPLLKDGVSTLPAESFAAIIGVRVSPPDGLPLAGLWKGKISVLTGLGRNGLLTAPLLARAVARQLVFHECPPWFAPFSPHRRGLTRMRTHSRSERLAPRAGIP